MNNDCCTQSFSDSAIKSYIQTVGVTGLCDFCGSKGSSGTDINQIARFIDEGIGQKYERVEEHMAHESPEGGFQVGTLSVAEVLLNEERAFDEGLESPDSLADEICCNSMLSTGLVRRRLAICLGVTRSPKRLSTGGDVSMAT